ncbi:hypothetical protein, partial [Nocardia sp. NPDC003345]
KITADTPPATSLLRVSVTDADPETGRVLADQVVAQVRALIDELETIEATAAPAARVAVVDAAQTPTEPSGPGSTRLLAVGALGGLLLGAAVSYLLDRLDKKIRDTAELQAVGQPVLGTVALGEPGERADLRALRARLPEAGRLLVTGLDTRTEPGAVLGLAAVLGATGDRVLVIDADTTGAGVSTLLPETLRQRTATEWPVREENSRRELVTAASSRTTAAVRGEVFDPPTVKLDLRAGATAPPLEEIAAPTAPGGRAGDGLAAILREEARVDHTLVPWPEESVTILALGSADDRTPDLLASARFDTVLAETAQKFDHIIVDTSPADAAAVAPKVTAVLGVVQLGRDRGDHVTATLAALTGAGATVAGVAAVPRRSRWRRS